jgi:hypothetical protein
MLFRDIGTVGLGWSHGGGRCVMASKQNPSSLTNLIRPGRQVCF